MDPSQGQIRVGEPPKRAAKRPGFVIINGGPGVPVVPRKPHIFDNMITMMEKYTNNLEVLVDERTHLLIVEKKKTGELRHDL